MNNISIQVALLLINVLLYILTSFVQAQEVRTGSFTIKSTSSNILGDEAASVYEKILKKNEELTWQIYVSENYDPLLPAGILLYQTYGFNIREPVGWKSVMDDKNLILVRLSSKETLSNRKEMLIGMLALLMIEKRYNINTERIYNTAYYECTVAGATAKIYPNIIKGSIYVNCVPNVWNKTKPNRLDLMRENRYVFVHGRDSRIKTIIEQAERKYRSAGIVNTKHMRLNRLNPRGNIDQSALLEAISFLDNCE